MKQCWEFSGKNFETAAVDWTLLATVPIKALPGEILSVSLTGELIGSPTDVRVTIDGDETPLWRGLSLGTSAAIVSDTSIRVPARAPLMELASYDTPRRIKFWIRTTRKVELRKWRIRIHPSLAA